MLRTVCGGSLPAVSVEPAVATALFPDRVADAVEHKRSQLVVGLDPRPDLLDLTLSDGRPLWQHVARIVHELGEELVGRRGLSSVGAVVGATHPRAVREARRLLPQAILLLPGVGAQGATPADLARAFTSGPASAVVNASRSVIYAFRSRAADWRTAAGLEAARLRREVWAVSGW